MLDLESRLTAVPSRDVPRIKLNPSTRLWYVVGLTPPCDGLAVRLAQKFVFRLNTKIAAERLRAADVFGVSVDEARRALTGIAEDTKLGE